jgi:hypothetical protein
MTFPLERQKIRYAFRVFLSFHTSLFVIFIVMRGVLVFFFPENLLVHAHYTLAHGWHSRHSSSAWNAARSPNLTFYYIFGCADMSSFSWCGAWRRMMCGLLPVTVSFFPLSFLSHARKNTDFSFLFLIFQFQSLFFWFLIFILIHFIKVLFVFNLVIQLQFLIWYFFHFGPYYFIFFLNPFVKVLLILNFILQSKFILFYFFQFDLLSFYLFLLLSRLFFVSI